MAALTFSWPCWTLMVVVVAATAFTFADQHITRHTGMNVTLEFPVPNGTTSGWLKKPDSDKYICYCQDRRPTRPEDQEASFKGRLKGMDCDNINSIFSLTVSNLTQSDSGTYQFHWVDRDGRRSNENIFLNVTDPGPPGGTSEDGGREDGMKEDGGKEDGGSVGLIVGLIVVLIVVLSVAAVLLIAAVFVIYRKGQQGKKFGVGEL